MSLPFHPAGKVVVTGSSAAHGIRVANTSASLEFRSLAATALAVRNGSVAILSRGRSSLRSPAAVICDSSTLTFGGDARSLLAVASGAGAGIGPACRRVAFQSGNYRIRRHRLPDRRRPRRAESERGGGRRLRVRPLGRPGECGAPLRGFRARVPEGALRSHPRQRPVGVDERARLCAGDRDRRAFVESRVAFSGGK
jgi:hypothetical protein